MKKITVSLDIGGTEIKAAAIENGRLLSHVEHFQARSKESAEIILENMVNIIRKTAGECEISRICFAFPGPFDYENGVCLIRSLDKYEALYQMNLKRYFAREFGLADESVVFCNDVAGFALGETAYGQAMGESRAMFVCIGTGCGSAFVVNGKLCADESEGIPKDGYIYSAPFLRSCIDDYISARGISEISKTILGDELRGKELEELARAGNECAKKCYALFGERLCGALTPFIDSFKPTVLCIGGQITKSGERFLPPLREYCKSAGCRLYISAETSEKAILGASLM